MSDVATTTAAESIPLADAADLFPRRKGKKVHITTLRRWVTKGSGGVRLEAEKVGHDWFVTPAAVAKFRRECTALGQPSAQTTAPAGSPTAGRDTAREYLRRTGFYSSNSSEPLEE